MLLQFAGLLALGGSGAYGASIPATFDNSSEALYNALSAPYYPSPIGGRINDKQWDSAYESARAFVSQLSLVEKVNVTTGIGFGMGPCVGNTGAVPRINFSSICLQDGPAGVGHTDFVTVFPSGMATAATWNKEYFLERGRAMGHEALIKGVQVLLAPVSGPIGYKALSGRNFEAMGSDPYLSGVAGAATVRGIQQQGVMANAKHYIAYEQERFRTVAEAALYGIANISYPLSTNVDDRTMHEVFTWPFADMIKAGVGSIMTSYNSINNSQASQNSYTLNKILKEELGFPGFVMTDWFAHDSGVASALAGLDMSMPGSGTGFGDFGRPMWGQELVKSVLNGTMPEWRVDDMATRIMAAYYFVGLDKNGQNGPNFHSSSLDTFMREYPAVGEGDIVQQNFHVNARTQLSANAAFQGAVESFVLLKNTQEALPLKNKKAPRTVGILGIGAAPPPKGSNGYPMGMGSEGALTNGWGSSAVMYPHLISPYEAINARAIVDGINVNYNFESWFDDGNQTDNNPVAELLNGAAFTQAAKYNDVNLIFVLADSGESFPVDGNYGDRNNASLWHNGDEVILKAASMNKNNVVIVTANGPVDMEKWIDHENVTAVLYNPPNGQHFGAAATAVIFGDESPSGHLPFTIARDVADYDPIQTELEPSDLNNTPQDSISRGLLLDYKWFDNNDISPRFEFGYGLSYASYKLDNINVATIHEPKLSLSQQEPYRDIKPRRESTSTADECVFPLNFKKVTRFIYPYLESAEDAQPQYEGMYPYPEGYSENHPMIPPVSGGGIGGNPDLWEIAYRVTVDVTNTDTKTAKFTPQLYLSFPKGNGTLPTPPRQLRGFEKVKLHPGSTTRVAFDLTVRDISVWDVVSQSWIVMPGDYRAYVGKSSRDLNLSAGFYVSSHRIAGMDSENTWEPLQQEVDTNV